MTAPLTRVGERRSDHSLGHTDQLKRVSARCRCSSRVRRRGDFPIKRAFLAFLQADAVGDHIAADVTGREFRQPFDPVSMCIMEMFDKATFAQVPVELTGDADRARGTNARVARAGPASGCHRGVRRRSGSAAQGCSPASS